MDSRLKKIVVCLVAVVCSVFVFAGCSDPIEKYATKISELRQNIYTVVSDSYTGEIITGTREKEFVLDGYCSGSVDYTLITVTPLSNACDNYEYSVILNGVIYSGAMVRHPFGNSYSAEIEVISYDSDIECKIICSCGEQELSFCGVYDDSMITPSRAVEIAESKLSSSLSTLRVNGELNAEIYVRLMNNPIDSSGGYYWYVAFVGSASTLYAVLIDPMTGEVVANRG